MSNNLRHSFLPLLLLGMLSACDSQDPQEQTGSSAMKFNVALNTRAEVMTSGHITAYPFAVFSDMISIDRTPESQYISIHDATVVRWNTSDRKWSYDNLQYWFPGFQYSFVALYPAGLSYLSDIQYSNNQLKFTYNQPADYHDASDLLISTHRRDYPGGDATPVNFGFSHILTNMNVEVTYNGSSSGPSSITIDELTFRNIPTKSTYAIKPAPLTANSTMTSDWVNDDNSQKGWTLNERGSLNITFPEDAPRIVEANKGSFKLFSGNDALFLLPNILDPENQPELVMIYTTSTGEKETVSAIIPTGWDPASSITLGLKLDNGLVQFSVTVNDWLPKEPVNTTVPRK